MTPNGITLFARSLFRIKPSVKYGGIGLFAVRNIERGSVIAKWEDLNEDLFFSWQDFETLDDATREMVLDYCAQTEEGFHAPLDLVDGAARVYDPIVRGENGELLHSCFLKDYSRAAW